MTASLQLDDGRSVLRFERLIGHARERVWRAVTDPGELVRWFPSAVIYEPRAGAAMQFDFGGEHGLDVWPGEVLVWDPPHVFAFLWGDDELRFELTAEGDDTRLVLTHAFAHQPGKEARDGAGWAACLEAFDALLAGDEHPVAGEWSAHHADHLGRFGELTLRGDGGSERTIELRGPYMEVDGHAAINVAIDDEPGVLVVRDAGAPLAHEAPIEIRTGSVAEPGGTVLAAGTLHDPLA